MKILNFYNEFFYILLNKIFKKIEYLINKIKSKECFDCKNNIFFKSIKIYNDDETLNEIIKYNKSISRFGDGEFKIIFGTSLGFQQYNKELSIRLLNILNRKEKNLLIGINLPYKAKNLDKFKPFAKNYYKQYFKIYIFKLAKLFKNKKYYSSRISRFYIDFKSTKTLPKYIKKLKMLWNQRDIAIVEGEKSRLGIGNNLFNNCKSVIRILCPIKNAFNRYKEILNTIQSKVSKNKLILIALGPTATILSYDLYKCGYQAIDIGHVDIEYEWYLRKSKQKIPIKNKYVEEIYGKNQYFTKVNDTNYYSQIIAKILGP